MSGGNETPPRNPHPRGLLAWAWRRLGLELEDFGRLIADRLRGARHNARLIAAILRGRAVYLHYERADEERAYLAIELEVER